jgi:hypothetical protein
LESEDKQQNRERDMLKEGERERRGRGVDCWLPASQEFALKYSARE